MQTRGTFPELYEFDPRRSATMAIKKNGDDAKAPTELEALAARLGLRDAEGKLDLDAARRTLGKAAPTAKK
jgi:hypothetical protein